jgi:hypothetical protein
MSLKRADLPQIEEGFTRLGPGPHINFAPNFKRELTHRAGRSLQALTQWGVQADKLRLLLLNCFEHLLIRVIALLN